MGHYLSKPSSREVVVASSQNVSKSHSESSLQENRQQEEEIEEIVDTEGSVRRIIIKIQLAKMENGNEQVASVEQSDQLAIAEGAATSAVDTLNANEQIVNVTLGAAGGAATIATVSGAGAAAGAIRTAGSSTEAPKTNERQLVNNNNSNGNLAGSVASASTAVKSLQLHDDSNNEVYFIGTTGINNDASDDDDDESEIATSSLLRRRRSRSRSSSTEGVEYCEVLEPPSVNEMLSSEAQRTQGKQRRQPSQQQIETICESVIT